MIRFTVVPGVRKQLRCVYRITGCMSEYSTSSTMFSTKPNRHLMSRNFTTNSFNKNNQTDDDYDIDFITLKRRFKKHKKCKAEKCPLLEFKVPEFSIPYLDKSQYLVLFDEATKPIYDDFYERLKVNQSELPFTVQELKEFCEYAASNSDYSLAETLWSFATNYPLSSVNENMIITFQSLLEARPVFESHFNTVLYQIADVTLQLEGFFTTGLFWFTNELLELVQFNSKKEVAKAIDKILVQYQRQQSQLPKKIDSKNLKISFKITRWQKVGEILDSLNYPMLEISYIMNLSNFEESNHKIKQANFSMDPRMTGFLHYLSKTDILHSPEGNYRAIIELEELLELSLSRSQNQTEERIAQAQNEMTSWFEEAKNYLCASIIKDSSYPAFNSSSLSFKIYEISGNPKINYLTSVMVLADLPQDLFDTYGFPRSPSELKSEQSQIPIGFENFRTHLLGSLDAKLGDSYFDWIPRDMPYDEFEDFGKAFLYHLNIRGMRMYEIAPSLVPIAGKLRPQDPQGNYSITDAFTDVNFALEESAGWEKYTPVIEELGIIWYSIGWNSGEVLLKQLINDKTLVENYYNAALDRYIEEIKYIQVSCGPRMNRNDFDTKLAQLVMDLDTVPNKYRRKMSLLNQLWNELKQKHPNDCFKMLQAVLINDGPLARMYQPRLEYKQIPDDLNIHDFVPSLKKLKSSLGVDSFAAVSPEEIGLALQHEIDTLSDETEINVLGSNKSPYIELNRLMNRLSSLFDINGGDTQVLDLVLYSQLVFERFEQSKVSKNHQDDVELLMSQEYKQIPDDLNVHDFVPELHKLKSALGVDSFGQVSPEKIIETLQDQFDSQFENNENEIMGSNRDANFDSIKLMKKLQNLFYLNGGYTQVLDLVLNSHSVFEEFEKSKSQRAERERFTTEEYKQIPEDLDIHKFVPELIGLKSSLGVDSFADVSPEKIIRTLQNEFDSQFDETESDGIGSNRNTNFDSIRLMKKLQRFFDTNGGNTQVWDAVINSHSVFEEFERGKLMKEEKMEYKQIPDDLNIHDFVPELTRLKSSLGVESFEEVSPEKIVEALQNEFDSQFENYENEVIGSNHNANFDSLRLMKKLQRLFDINGGHTQILDLVLNSNSVFEKFEKDNVTQKQKNPALSNSDEYKQIPDDLNIHDFVQELIRLKSTLAIDSFGQVSPEKIIETLQHQFDSQFENYENEVMGSNHNANFDTIRLMKKLQRLFDTNGGNTQVLDLILNSHYVFENFEKGKTITPTETKLEPKDNDGSIILSKLGIEAIKKDVKSKNSIHPKTPVEIATGVISDKQDHESRYANLEEFFSSLDKEPTGVDFSFIENETMLESLKGAIHLASDHNVNPPSPPQITHEPPKLHDSGRNVQPPEPPSVIPVSTKDSKNPPVDLRAPSPPHVISNTTKPDAESRIVKRHPKRAKKKHPSIDVSGLEDFLQHARQENTVRTRAREAFEWSTSNMYKGIPTNVDLVNNPNTSYILLTLEGEIVPISRDSLGTITEEDIFTMLNKFEKSDLKRSLAIIRRLNRQQWKLISSRIDGDKKYFILARARPGVVRKVVRTVKTLFAVIGVVLISLIGINYWVEDIEIKENEEYEAKRLAAIEAATEAQGPFRLVDEVPEFEPEEEEMYVHEQSWWKKFLWK